METWGLFSLSLSLSLVMNNSLSLSISFKPHQTLDYAKTSPFPMSCVFLLALASFSHIRNQKVLLFLYYAIVISPNSLSHVLLVLVLHMFFSPSHVVLKGLGWTFTFWSLRSESFWCGDIKRLGWRFCFSFVSFFFAIMVSGLTRCTVLNMPFCILFGVLFGLVMVYIRLIIVMSQNLRCR
jgi:hypothetical protein